MDRLKIKTKRIPSFPGFRFHLSILVYTIRTECWGIFLECSIRVAFYINLGGCRREKRLYI